MNQRRDHIGELASRRRLGLVLGLYATTVLSATAHAVILLGSDDPAANNTAPTGTLASSGWQYEGQWGPFLGTPIAPHFLVSADHVGNQNTLVYQGVSYPVVAGFKDPYSDLHLWQISANQSFATFAPLYLGGDEAGKPLIVIGRGTQRGNPITLDGTARGWNWGSGDGVQRWGENTVTSAVHDDSGYGDLLYSTFDSIGGLPNECHLSSGDSGGAVFVQENGIWKLAGINLGVDDLYSAPADGSIFSAAIHDSRGYYTKTGATFDLITGSGPVPTGFYATRISIKADWIYSVIDPTGDADGDGTPNLLQYARTLNAPRGQDYHAPTLAVTTNSATITYHRISNAGLVYQVQQSNDLAIWSAATVTESIAGTAENVQTVNASVARPSSGRLFLRVVITQ